MDFPRREQVDHVAGKDNLSLLIPRQITGEWHHAGVSKEVTESGWVSIKSKELCSIFPLWLYTQPVMADEAHPTPPEKTVNFAPEFLGTLTDAIGNAPTPEDVLAYIYAVLYAPSYRIRYANFLKRDFPHVPIPSDRKLFKRLVKVGNELMALHTMKKTMPRITGYPVEGTNKVIRVRFTPPADTENQTGRVWINNQQYFDGVPLAVWEMYIGSHRVAEKWLKDRKNRQLTYDDVESYHNAIAALARTLELQTKLDQGIDDAGGWPLK
jgi:predicted helicase